MRSPDALLTLLLLSSYWQLNALADADWATIVRGFGYSERGPPFLISTIFISINLTMALLKSGSRGSVHAFQRPNPLSLHF
ncbi:hypothetical protein BGY98DRAFT_1026102 [Russula aff. rugulosa BPL654]|nr:hypothetical protein BGY98DRAFT_1026102 [Russula aff. rugulosa BPL654]